jgi:hypothetical protein
MASAENRADSDDKDRRHHTHDTYSSLKGRIEAFTAKKTPVSEPGREIENIVNNHIKPPLLKLLYGDKSALLQLNPVIKNFRKIFKNNNTLNSNYCLSYNTCNTLANEAQAIIDDILAFRDYLDRASKST